MLFKLLATDRRAPGQGKLVPKREKRVWNEIGWKASLVRDRVLFLITVREMDRDNYPGVHVPTHHCQKRKEFGDCLILGWLPAGLSQLPSAICQL